MDELLSNIRDAIFVFVAFHQDYEGQELEFIGLQRIKVPLKELDDASKPKK